MRIIRFLLGFLLPVPLFVGFYYFSYFYKAYQGFDHENNIYLPNPQSIETARQHLGTDILFFVAMGFLLMGIPSLIYSLLLERYRMGSRFSPISYAGWGALMGGISGLIAVCLRFLLVEGVGGALVAILVSSFVGGVIPLLLIFVRSGTPDRLKA